MVIFINVFLPSLGSLETAVLVDIAESLPVSSGLRLADTVKQTSDNQRRGNLL
jgi:hypothetical protein